MNKIVSVKAIYEKKPDVNWNKIMYVLYSDNTWEKIIIHMPYDLVTRTLRLSVIQNGKTKEEVHDIVRETEQKIERRLMEAYKEQQLLLWEEG